MNIYVFFICSIVASAIGFFATMHFLTKIGVNYCLVWLGLLYILAFIFRRVLERWQNQALANSFNSKFWFVRRDAVSLSSRYWARNAQLTDQLENALNDEDERVVLAAAKVLKKTEIIYALTSKDISKVVSVLNNENPDIRARACRTLMNIGLHSFSALPALKELAGNDTDNSVRSYAKRAIARIEPLPYDDLVKLLSDFNWIERKYAAEALGYIGPKAMHQIPKLREIAEFDDSPQVREAAKRTISGLENPPAD